MRPKVLVPKGFNQEAVELMNETAEVLYFKGITAKERAVELTDADAAVAGGVTEELLQAAPRLRIIARYGVGYDDCDVEAATRHGVYLTHTPGVLSDAVSDLTMLLILSLARGIRYADRYTRQEWAKNSKGYPSFGLDLAAKTLGIIGLGRIGYAVAKRAKAFGMDIVYYDEFPNKAAENDFGARKLDLAELLKQSDFVTIHCNLTPKTAKLIGKKEIALMKRTAFLVNTARGPVVDQKALTQALREKQIAGAGLDVFEKEPILQDDPLLGLGNVVVTPHMGSLTYEARRAMALMDAKNINQVLRGEVPDNVVPEQRGRIFRRD